MGGGYSQKDLARYFQDSLGEARAVELVVSKLVALGYPREGLTKAQVLSVLEALAQEKGLVGIVARFAKGKAILELPEEKSTPSSLPLSG